MIVDVTGTALIPGNHGKACPGSWEHAGWDCCCDECGYMMCCMEAHDPKECLTCSDRDCPHSPNCTE